MRITKRIAGLRADRRGVAAMLAAMPMQYAFVMRLSASPRRLSARAHTTWWYWTRSWQP